MANGTFGRFMDWLDARLPVTATYERHLSKHPVPTRVNAWYLFGAFATVMLVVQLVSGIWLMMSYQGTTEDAFASIEYIMRDVEFGWLLRYIHSTGASALFAVVYLHMFRGLLYGSYRKPRELVWILGMAIYVALMAEGFFGYVLPWGQMSYWGAQVIVSLFGAIPWVGEDLVTWVRGDYLISGITLNRFFALHVVALPLVLVALVFVHLIALHEVGAGNPHGVDVERYRDRHGVPLDSLPFHPYKTMNALFGLSVFAFVFCFILFFFPEGGGYLLEPANFEKANPLKTPEHIVPVWYYMPYYAMLRAVTYPLFGVDAKFWGLFTMAAAIAIFFVMPWLDRSPVASIKYRGRLSKLFLGLFVVSFLVLGYLGSVPPSNVLTLLAQIATAMYFSFFLLMPWYTSYERTRQMPDRLP